MKIRIGLESSTWCDMCNRITEAAQSLRTIQSTAYANDHLPHNTTTDSRKHTSTSETECGQSTWPLQRLVAYLIQMIDYLEGKEDSVQSFSS